MNVRDYLLASGVPRTVVWVSNDLRVASLSIEYELYDLLTKRNARDAVYRAGAHYIMGISPMSQTRARGLSVDAVFLECSDFLPAVVTNLYWCTVGKEKVWWFDERGDLNGPPSSWGCNCQEHK